MNITNLNHGENSNLLYWPLTFKLSWSLFKQAKVWTHIVWLGYNMNLLQTWTNLYVTRYIWQRWYKCFFSLILVYHINLFSAYSLIFFFFLDLYFAECSPTRRHFYYKNPLSTNHILSNETNQDFHLVHIYMDCCRPLSKPKTICLLWKSWLRKWTLNYRYNYF